MEDTEEMNKVTRVAQAQNPEVHLDARINDLDWPNWKMGSIAKVV